MRDDEQRKPNPRLAFASGVGFVIGGLSAVSAALFPWTDSVIWRPAVIVVAILVTSFSFVYYSRACGDASYAQMARMIHRAQSTAQPLVWAAGSIFLVLATTLAISTLIKVAWDWEDIFNSYLLAAIALAILRMQYTFMSAVLSSSSRANAGGRYFATLLAAWLPTFGVILYSVALIGKGQGASLVLTGVFVAIVTTMSVAIAARRVSFSHAYKELSDLLSEMYLAHEALRRDASNVAAVERVRSSYLSLEGATAVNSSLPRGFGSMPGMDLELRIALAYSQQQIAPMGSSLLSERQESYFRKHFPKGVTTSDASQFALDLRKALLYGTGRNAHRLAP